MTTFTTILQKEDDMYVANCPEVGTVSQGYTVDEAIKNLKEATELYLDETEELSDEELKQIKKGMKGPFISEEEFLKRHPELE